MKVFRTVLALAVSLMIVGNLSAAEKKREKQRPERPRQEMMGGMRMIQMMFRGLDLSEEQKTKLEELSKEYAPKFKAVEKKRAGILTEEQVKARREAMKEAREAGKTPKEIREAGEEAAQITDEQKTKLAEVQKEAQALRKEFIEKGKELLTPEQKEKLKERMEHRRRPGRPNQPKQKPEAEEKTEV